MAKQTIDFLPDGTCKVSAEKNAERELDWLLKNLGEVQFKGHKHTAKSEEEVKLRLH